MGRNDDDEVVQLLTHLLNDMRCSAMVMSCMCAYARIHAPPYLINRMHGHGAPLSPYLHDVALQFFQLYSFFCILFTPIYPLCVLDIIILGQYSILPFSLFAYGLGLAVSIYHYHARLGPYHCLSLLIFANHLSQ
jgi:hypothetical protein